MRQFLNLKRSTIERRSLERRKTKEFFADPDFYIPAWEILRAVEDLAAGQEPGLQARIYQGVADGYEDVLAGVRQGSSQQHVS